MPVKDMICRMCRIEDLFEFLDLGFQPPANEFLRKEQLVYPRIAYPLRVLLAVPAA